jgi:hypothetical protein
MGDQFRDPVQEKQGFPACEGHRLDPFFPGRIQDLPDDIGFQTGSADIRGFPHAALGACGIALIGDLDDQLSGHPVFCQAGQSLENRKERHGTDILIIVFFRSILRECFHGGSFRAVSSSMIPGFQDNQAGFFPL